MDLYVGNVDEVTDDTYKIKFTVPNLIESGLAHPLIPALTPFVGDEVLILKPESIVNSLFYYVRLDRPKSLRIAANGAQVRIEGGQIYLEARTENPNEKTTTEPAIKGDIFLQYFKGIIDTISNASYIQGVMDPISKTKLETQKMMLDAVLSNIVKLQ